MPISPPGRSGWEDMYLKLEDVVHGIEFLLVPIGKFC